MFHPLSRAHSDTTQLNWLDDQPNEPSIARATCCGEPDGCTAADDDTVVFAVVVCAAAAFAAACLAAARCAAARSAAARAAAMRASAAISCTCSRATDRKST